MFGWTRRLARNTTSAKPQTTLKFRPTLDGFEERLVPTLTTGLGAAGDYAVLTLSRGETDLTRTTIDGDVGVGYRGRTNFARSAVTGAVYADQTARIDRTGLAITGGVVRQDMAQAAADALAASQYFAGLAPTQNVGNLNNDLTLTGTGDVNVIKVNNLNLGLGDVLFLDGGANDVFVFNVTGNFRVQSGAIQLNGGVTADHVIFNVPTNGNNVTVSGQNSVFKGTILAPTRTVDDTRTGAFTGSIIARNVNVTAGDVLHELSFTLPSGNPGQGSASLSGHVSGPTGDLGGVPVTLTNLATLQVVAVVETDPFGNYTFTNLSAGTYSISILQADLDAIGFYALGGATAGQNATDNGTADVGSITGIVVDGNDVGTGFNFLVVTPGGL